MGSKSRNTRKRKKVFRGNQLNVKIASKTVKKIMWKPLHQKERIQVTLLEVSDDENYNIIIDKQCLLIF